MIGEDLRYRYGFRGKNDEVFPPMVFAEITNVCNLNCVHCPYSYISKQESYVPRHMSLEVYKKIVDELSLHKEAILRLVCDGEPMLHPDFLEIISYAAAKGIKPLCLNTNGTLLNEKIAIEILKFVDLIEISLDALNENTYEYLRKGARYRETMLNVCNLISLRNSLNAKTKIMVSIIDQPEIKKEMDGFIKYWTPKVDRVITRTYTTIGGLVDKDKLRLANAQERWPCPLIWSRIFVSVDGVIKFCVEDWLDKTALFHIKNCTIGEAWRSAEYQKIRESHLFGRFQEIPYCKECIDWPARSWDYDYFYALEKTLKQ
jgi:uncharacterized radical SAM superfamily Fe-S cluster-containing enzyme